MARQKGLMKYIGTIGDVRHFKIKGQPGFYAGLVGGPTAQQVKTAPEFERTRENMNEFGGCARTGKSLRTALSQVMSKMADSQVTGRLTSVMKKINLEYAGDTISAVLPGAPTLANNVTVVQCIGIEFFQEVNGQYYPFASGNCLKIEDAF